MRYLGLAVVSALGLSVNAQDEDHLRRENTIIVTAPGPEKLAGELISNVDAISGAELISSLQGTLGDTLASRPGVSTTYFGAGASRPCSRRRRRSPPARRPASLSSSGCLCKSRSPWS